MIDALFEGMERFGIRHFEAWLDKKMEISLWFDSLKGYEEFVNKLNAYLDKLTNEYDLTIDGPYSSGGIDLLMDTETASLLVPFIKGSE